MASELERTIQHYRAQVLSRDTAALTRLELAYQDSLDRLRPAIELLQQQVNGLDDPKPGDVFKLDRYRTLAAQMETELRRLARLAESQTAFEQRALVTLSGDATEALVRATAPQILMSWVRVPTSGVIDLVGALSDGSPLAQFFDNLAPDGLLRARALITDGLIRGQHPRTVADALVKALKMNKESAMLTSRNALIDAYRSSSIRRYAENSDIVESWIWTSALNARTCPACLHLNNTEWPLTEQFMRRHPACRCSPRPKLRGIAGPRVQSGDEWLRQQPAKAQNRVLGSTAAGASFRAGDVELRDFVMVKHSEVWGDSYQADSLRGAIARSEQRQRSRRAA